MNHSTKKLLVIAALSTVLAAPAFAQQAPRRDAQAQQTVKSELLNLRQATKGLQRSLAQGKGELSNPVHVGVQVTAVACTFIIIGRTFDAAYKHAKDLEDQGCNCKSSGETEFTCDCPDSD